MQSIHLRDLVGDSAVSYFGVGGSIHCEGMVKNPTHTDHRIVRIFFSFPGGRALNIIRSGADVAAPDMHACLEIRNPFTLSYPGYYICLRH